MKILHYTLGLPPYRTGGLAKYSMDLIQKQITASHDVSLLYPGHFKIGGKTSVKKQSRFQGAKVFEIVNPLPVSLLGGIIDPLKFMEDVSPSNVYRSFLSQIEPDIIHIHTLMGIHKDFFVAAKELNIKMVFTTHDYFGLCPKVNLIDYKGNVCTDNNNGQKCVNCNQNAYSLPLIYFMQSKTYRRLKDHTLTKKMRKAKNKQIKAKLSTELREIEDLELANKFGRLSKFYIDILQLIDFIHFNSEITKNEYLRYIDVPGCVIPISHNEISDKRNLKEYDFRQPLKITFLGPTDSYKGFPLLRKSLNILLEQGAKDFRLNVYGNTIDIILDEVESNHISFHGRYHYSKLASIMKHTDVLVIPSIWKETFGFIGLEALSYGVPILISEYVGCKDIIKDGKTGIIFEPNAEVLSEKINEIINNRTMLVEINQNICNGNFSHSMDIHVNQIDVLYKEVIGVLS